MRMNELLQNPKILLELEPEELGGFILQYLIEVPERGDRQCLNRHNYMNYIGRNVRDRTTEVLRAVTEGWTWLVREGLIATDPEPGHEWAFVTRRGQRLRNRDAFASYRHASRLPRGRLHPPHRRSGLASIPPW